MNLTFPSFNEKQLDRLSEFYANLALVFFATLVAPILTGVDNINPFNIVLGAALTIVSLSLSLYTIRNRKE